MPGFPIRDLDRRAALASVILLALGGSANAWFENRSQRLQSIKTVGIISAIGDQFSLVRAGLTVPDNSPRHFPIGSWGLDDLITRQATVAISGRFQVQPVTYDRAAFATTRESGIAPVKLVRGDPFKTLVRESVTPQGLDAYIVITKARANIGSGGQKLEGVGLATYGTLLESYSQIHALYEIRLIDGKTFDVIQKLPAPPLDDAGDIRLPGPSRRIDAGFALGSGDVRDENLHKAIVDLIVRSLPITLSDMQLVAAP